MLFELGASVEYGHALHFAVRNNRPEEVIDVLLEKGASLNSILFERHGPSFYYYREFGLGTPLHEAVCNGHERLADLLRKKGARVDIVDTLGRLPQYYTK